MTCVLGRFSSSLLYFTIVYSKSMPFFSRKKKHPESPSTRPRPLPVDSAQITQQLYFPTNSQSQSQSPQEKQQLQLVCTWSSHIPPSGLSPSPLPRYHHALSSTVTAAGELFLFGGHIHGSIRNGLYVISTRDFSTTLLQTSGQVPNPCYGHRAALTSTILLIWGGITSGQVMENQDPDDSFYLLNLGTYVGSFDIKTRSG